MVSRTWRKHLLAGLVIPPGWIADKPSWIICENFRSEQGATASSQSAQLPRPSRLNYCQLMELGVGHSWNDAISQLLSSV